MPRRKTPPQSLLLRFLRLGCVLLMLVASLPLSAQSTFAQHQSIQDPFGTGIFVTASDRKVFVHCAGLGSPLVVLEHGLGGSTHDWALVQDELARHTTVCSYDRAGEGRSDADPGSPHNAEDASRDLDAVLEALQVETPIVLAGFSIGGLLARYYATTRPRAVAALVLIDPTPPVATAMAITGAAIEPRIDGLLRFSGMHPRVAERLDILKASEEVFMLGAPRLPVWMLTAGVKSLNAGMAGDQQSRLTTRLQNDQARYLDAQHLIVAGCTHAMPVDCPEAVIEVITSAVDDVRRSDLQLTAEEPVAVVSDPPKLRRIVKRRDRVLSA